MRTHWLFGLVLVAAACSTSSANVSKLRAALDRAQISLGDSVNVAESEGGSAVRASLLTAHEPVFSVHDLAAGTLEDVRVDIVSGAVLSRSAGTGDGGACVNAVALSEAIAAAEAEVGGEAVSSGPDDDGNCNTEVIVLVDNTLWEVKIGADGALVEPPEHADDAEGADAGE